MTFAGKGDTVTAYCTQYGTNSMYLEPLPLCTLEFHTITVCKPNCKRTPCYGV